MSLQKLTKTHVFFGVSINQTSPEEDKSLRDAPKESFRARLSSGGLAGGFKGLQHKKPEAPELQTSALRIAVCGMAHAPRRHCCGHDPPFSEKMLLANFVDKIEENPKELGSTVTQVAS